MFTLNWEEPRVRSGFNLGHPPVQNPQMCHEEEKFILSIHTGGILPRTCSLVFSNTFSCVSENMIHCWDDRSVTIKHVPLNSAQKILSEKAVDFWSFSGYEACQFQLNGKRHDETSVSSDSSITPPESGVISMTKRLCQTPGLKCSS